jgi:hypothetical protein
LRQLAAFIQQPVYVRATRRPIATEEPKLAVDGLDVAHARSVCPPAAGVTSPLFLGGLFSQIDDCRVGSGFLDRFDTLLGVGLLLVRLAGGDDLAVGCFEVPPELAGLVIADLELACRPAVLLVRF